MIPSMAVQVWVGGFLCIYFLGDVMMMMMMKTALAFEFTYIVMDDILLGGWAA